MTTVLLILAFLSMTCGLWSSDWIPLDSLTNQCCWYAILAPAHTTLLFVLEKGAHRFWRPLHVRPQHECYVRIAGQEYLSSRSTP